MQRTGRNSPPLSTLKATVVAQRSEQNCQYVCIEKQLNCG